MGRVSTYSIIARDAATGQMGAAVQSHYFSVGPIVPWAEAGVGAVCTQSMVDVSYGPLGLEAMREGQGAREALTRLLAADESAPVRQVAMLDARGGIAAHTGHRCIAAAGHVLGEEFSVQANMMENETVWPAMAAAWKRSAGDLAERMLCALEAAEQAGGDVRGRQSAALVVVGGARSGQAWQGRVMDLRVEDAPEPLAELRRLVRLRRAYNFEDEGDGHIAAGRVDEARAAYAEAARLAPEVEELVFWEGVSLFNAGQEAEALKRLGPLLRQGSQWAKLLPRLAPSELLRGGDEAARRILKSCQ